MEINKKELVETLSRGRNSAKKLQNLLHQKDNDDDELLSVDDLVTDISQSFYGGLLVLSSSSSGEHSSVPVSAHLSSASSGDQTPRVVKGKRGCYKRRKSMDSRMEVRDTFEDGYAWRKYGQKVILNSSFPRCYFRCTHKQVHGCKALKQVQELEDGSNMFHITYIGNHTCPAPNSPSTITNIHIDPSSKHEDVPNKVSSDTGAESSHALVWKEIPSSITNNHIDSSLKQEDLSNQVLSNSPAESSPALVWKEIPSPSTKTHSDPFLKHEDLFNKVSSDGGEESSLAFDWKEILQNEFDCFKGESLSDVSLDDLVFS